MSFETTQCRACGGRVDPILDLGHSPIANRLLKAPAQDVACYPLGLVQCKECALVQNSTCLPGALLFGADYPYFSSTSMAVRNHAAALAKSLSARLSSGTRCIEIGSNDGTVQLALAKYGIDCLGVDPSEAPTRQARKNGCRTITAPFDAKIADQLMSGEAPFEAAVMSNVLAHVSQPLDLLKNLSLCLAPDALLVIEFQSWLDLAQSGAFDMVYHEHHSHFSLTSAGKLLERAGFGIEQIEHISMQGGSLRLWCRKNRKHDQSIRGQITAETKALAQAPATLRNAVEQFRQDISAFLDTPPPNGLVGYGAAAKTVTLLAAAGIDWPLEAIADAAPSKAGKYLPIGNVPIVAPEDLPRQPDIFLFAWNLAAEITPRYPDRKIWSPIPRLRRLQ